MEVSWESLESVLWCARGHACQRLETFKTDWGAENLALSLSLDYDWLTVRISLSHIGNGELKRVYMRIY